jgi:quinol monooxygenase YgiN
MVYGVVTIRVRPGKMADFLLLFRENGAIVRQEKGCHRYLLTADVESGMPIQAMDENVLTLLEEWESMDAIKEHLATTHMARYFEREKELVDGVTVRTLREV